MEDINAEEQQEQKLHPLDLLVVVKSAQN